MAPRLRVDAFDLSVEEIAHDVDVVRGEVVDDADVADAMREGADAPRAELEDAAALPSSRRRLSSWTAGLKRSMCPTVRMPPRASAAAGQPGAGLEGGAIGFSTSRWRPTR